MRLLLTAGALTLVVAVSARDGTTVNNGVFSTAQSERGEIKYLRNCRECHERNLMGGGYDDIPPIKGEEFLSNWLTWTVGDLFDFIQNEMPPKRKNRVGIEPGDYADILAYILAQNGYPSGQTELPPDFDPLSEIDMVSPPPASSRSSARGATQLSAGCRVRREALETLLTYKASPRYHTMKTRPCAGFFCAPSAQSMSAVGPMNHI